MELLKQKEKNNSIHLSALFLMMLILIDLFAFNPDRFEDFLSTNKLVLPYYRGNITVILMTLSLLFVLLISVRKRVTISRIELLLFLRIPLYFISIIYVTGDYKIGVAYAVIQCFFSYYIGVRYNGNIKSIIRLLFVFSVAISIEVFAVLLLNHITVFSPSLKWYMVIPMGRSNYIAAVLVPLFAVVNSYYKGNITGAFRVIYASIIILAVLGTGSKWGLIMLLGYIIIDGIAGLVKNKKVDKSIFVKGSLLLIIVIAIGVVVLIRYWNGLLTVALRYVTNDIFENRRIVFKDSINVFIQHPVFGRGAASFSVFDASKSHNWIFESLIQTGLVGTALFFYTLYKVIKKVQTKDPSISHVWMTFIVVYLIQGLAEPNLFGAVSDALFWFVIGVSNSKACDNQNDKLCEM